MQNELIINLEKLHTTPMGVERIKKNLNLDVDDVVKWCAEFILDNKTKIERKGKNWYASDDNIIITVNAYSYTIITAHRKK